jgi:hypothetical protein
MKENVITFNGVTLGDQAVRDNAFQSSPFYYFEVESIDDTLDLATEAYKISGGLGQRSGDTFTQSRTLTFSGNIWGLHFAALRAGQDALKSALSDRQMHHLIFQRAGEVQAYIVCKVLQDAHYIESQPDADRKRPYTFSLQADDPREYKVSDNTVLHTWMTSMQ